MTWIWYETTLVRTYVQLWYQMECVRSRSHFFISISNLVKDWICSNRIWAVWTKDDADTKVQVNIDKTTEKSPQNVFWTNGNRSRNSRSNERYVKLDLYYIKTYRISSIYLKRRQKKIRKTEWTNILTNRQTEWKHFRIDWLWTNKWNQIG